MEKNTSTNIQSAGEHFIDTFSRVLEEQIRSGEISIGGISSEMNISRSTLYRKIKKLTGYSTTKYIKEFQLQKAADLFSNDFGNVSEVAYESGFNNLSYFAKCFRKKFGINPAKYANQQEKNLSIAADITSFIGRNQEIEELKQLVKAQRLVNLTGPAGTGKTRLALKTADELSSSFQNGVHAIFLASVSDPNLVPSVILQELNVSENPTQSSLDRLVDHLKNRETLLLLDNFEHITEASSSILTLLRKCPGIKLLITSRNVLNLSCEYQYKVRPLPVPDSVDIYNSSEIQTLQSYPSVQLFLERAQAVSGPLEINKNNARELVEICRILDGLPLALELAASQTKLYSIPHLVEQLDENPAILKTRIKDRPERHQTLLAAITWSYDLLNHDEKILFQRLSLFSGSFDMDAAAALWKDEASTLDIIDGLRSLTDKNLIQTVKSKKEIRFRILETLKAYGRNKLSKSRNEKAAVRTLASYYLQMALNAKKELSGSKQKFWIKKLGQELDNFRGVLNYLYKQREVELGLRVSTALWRYWVMQNLIAEGSEWLKKMIGLANSLKSNEESNNIQVLKANALSAFSVAHAQLAINFQKTEEALRQCIIIFRKLDRKKQLANNLNHYGWIKAHMGDYLVAISTSEEAKEMHLTMNDKRGVSVSLNNLGWTANIRGNLKKAEQLLTESISIRKEINDQRGVAYVSSNLAWAEKGLGKYEAALSRLDSSYQSLSQLNDQQLMSWALTIKAYTLYEIGEYNEVIVQLKKALEGWKQVGNRYGLALSNNILGLSDIHLHNPKGAAKKFDQAHSLWNNMISKWGISFSDYCLAHLYMYNGESDQALFLHNKALTRRIQQDEKLHICESLEAISLIFFNNDNFRKPLIFLSAAESLREKIHAPLPPRFQDSYEEILSTCKTSMTKTSFNQSWNEGASLSLQKFPDLLNRH